MAGTLANVTFVKKSGNKFSNTDRYDTKQQITGTYNNYSSPWSSNQTTDPTVAMTTVTETSSILPGTKNASLSTAMITDSPDQKISPISEEVYIPIAVGGVVLIICLVVMVICIKKWCRLKQQIEIESGGPKLSVIYRELVEKNGKGKNLFIEDSQHRKPSPLPRPKNTLPRPNIKDETKTDTALTQVQNIYTNVTLKGVPLASYDDQNGYICVYSDEKLAKTNVKNEQASVECLYITTDDVELSERKDIYENEVVAVTKNSSFGKDKVEDTYNDYTNSDVCREQMAAMHSQGQENTESIYQNTFVPQIMGEVIYENTNSRRNSIEVA